MTLSPERQRQERRTLLSGMLEAIGDDHLCGQVLFKFGLDFSGVHASTWVDLEQEGLLEERHAFGPNYQYLMTTRGWYVALRESGHLQSERIVQRCQRLMQVLKALVGHGSTPADCFFDPLTDLPDSSGVPPSWAVNALASPLLYEVFPKHKVNHTLEEGTTFRVPMSFGRKRISQW